MIIILATFIEALAQLTSTIVAGFGLAAGFALFKWIQNKIYKTDTELCSLT